MPAAKERGPVRQRGGMVRQRGAARPLALMLAVVVWSWSWWALALRSGGSWLEFPNVVFTVLGMLGPLLVTAGFVAAGAWDAPSSAFWRDTFDPRRVAARWYAVALLLAALLAGVPVVLAALREGVAPWQVIEPSGSGAFLFVGALAGVVEEPAWRAYGQRALQVRVPVLLAALVIGVFWAAWHLPLFLIEGTYQASLGLGTEGFWTFNLALLAGSVVYAWLLGSAGGAAVVVVVYHALANVLRELWSVAGVERAELLVELALALVLVMLGWRWLRRTGGAAARTVAPRARA